MSMSSPLKKVRHAWRGLLLIFRTESSFRFQVACALLLVAILFGLPIESWKRAVLFTVAILVLVVESLNTAGERILDMVQPRWKEEVAVVKDMLAGSVLLVAVGAFILGAFILGPSILHMVSRV